MFGEDVSTSVTSPARKEVFKVREYIKKLSDKKGELFHLVVTELLLSQRGPYLT